GSCSGYGVPAAGGYPAQPYAGYPGTFSAPPTQDPMWGYFTAVAGQDGEVDAEELQRCLTQTGISGTYTPFSLETCRIMIAMLDRDYTGKMGFSEFKELFAVLNGWKQNFAMVDRDCSGTVEPHEMSQCIANMGYRISPQALNAIIKRYSRSGKIYFDDYVACFVKLRALTGEGQREYPFCLSCFYILGLSIFFLNIQYKYAPATEQFLFLFPNSEELMV
uniref:Grancalcin-like n=1 Tax=Sinocyclocheilus rhinocerous TaxID=307959 RepID=A0A673HJ13_9TELE